MDQLPDLLEHITEVAVQDSRYTKSKELLSNVFRTNRMATNHTVATISELRTLRTILKGFEDETSRPIKERTLEDHIKMVDYFTQVLADKVSGGDTRRKQEHLAIGGGESPTDTTSQ